MEPEETFGVSTHVLGSLEPEVHFGLFARYGFSCVELGLAYFPFLEDARRFEELQRVIAANGIRVYSFHLPYGGTVPALGTMDISHPDPDVRRNTLDAVRLCLERLEDLGAQCLVIHPSAGAVRSDDERMERTEWCLESLRACREVQAKRPEAVPVKIAVETLPPRGLLNSAAEIFALLDRLDDEGVGLCLDVNHINLAGQDPVEFTRQTGSFVITTHLSDNDGENEKHWIPGKGVLPWQELLLSLRSTGYAGPLLYETSQESGSSDEETVAELRNNAERLSAEIL